MIHVHGICFRVIGEAFATLPSVAAVVVSAFSQRPAKATAQVVDEYLISARGVAGVGAHQLPEAHRDRSPNLLRAVRAAPEDDQKRHLLTD